MTSNVKIGTCWQTNQSSKVQVTRTKEATELLTYQTGPLADEMDITSNTNKVTSCIALWTPNSVHHHQSDEGLYVDGLKLTLEGTILDQSQICQYSPSWAWSRTLQQSRNSCCCQKSGSMLEAFKLNFFYHYQNETQWA